MAGPHHLASVVVALLLAACSPPVGGEGSAPASEPAAPPAAGSARVLGQVPPATSGFASVILLEPRFEIDRVETGESPVLDQYGTAFFPAVLVARVGQPVEFRNSEDVAHNVHVVETATGDTAFNVATPIGGAYVHTFDRAGGYSVGCDIHPAMSAFILVTAAPFAVSADRDGRFSIDDVPVGDYTLTVWTPTRQIQQPIRIDAPEQRVTVEAGP